MTTGAASARPTGLLLDYGGVLTTPVGDSFGAWERDHGFAPGEVMRLIGRAYDDADGGLVGRFERGEIATQEFDAQLRVLLGVPGRELPAGSLVDAMFARMAPAGTRPRRSPGCGPFSRWRPPPAPCRPDPGPGAGR